jgi:tryptophan 2,3-dioxygenase
MRRDAIQKSAIEAAYLIYAERGHKILDYSHEPTDYQRDTVMEPNVTGKLKQAFNEVLPANSRNAEFNALQARDEAIEAEAENLQQQMRVSRQRGAFQALQAQMKKMNDLMKEKEAVNAQMSVANLGAAQMDIYDDTMDQDFSEMAEIGDKIAELEEMMLQYREQLEG